MQLRSPGFAMLMSLPVLLGSAAAAGATTILSESFTGFDDGIARLEQSSIGLIGERGPCWFASSGDSRAGHEALCSAGTADKGFDGDLYDSFSFDLGGLENGFRLDLSLAVYETGILDGPPDPARLLDFVDILVDGTQIVRFHGVHDTLELAHSLADVEGPDRLVRQFFNDFSFVVDEAITGIANLLTFKVRLTGGNEYVAFDSISVTALESQNDPNEIPLPASLALLGTGLVMLGVARRRGDRPGAS